MEERQLKAELWERTEEEENRRGKEKMKGVGRAENRTRVVLGEKTGKERNSMGENRKRGEF